MSARVKQKIRSTASIYGEGGHEQVFLKYLVRVYAGNQMRTKFTVRSGGGGSLDSVAEKMVKNKAGFDRLLMLGDKDRTEGDPDELVKARNICRSLDARLELASPCLDGLLLSILEPKLKLSGLDSKKCKARFENEYMSAKQRMKPDAYVGIFSREVLEEARTRLKNLDRIIRFIEK